MSFYRDFNDKIAIEAWQARDRGRFETIDIKPIGPALGAEVRGIDLRRELAPEQVAEIRRALATYLVLTFPEQPISAEDQKRLGRLFGQLHRHKLAQSRALSSNGPDPEILAWHTGRDSRYTAGDAWHADVTCDPEPISVSVLRLLRTPELGGDTAFANMYLAYDALSEPMKAFLAPLGAIHDGGQAWTAGYGAEPEPGKTFPKTEHPIVIRHPDTGRRALFVNSAFTSVIPSLTREESDAVLQLLYRHIERSLSFQTRIRWTPDLVIVWDNWAVQHHAVWDYYPHERWGERVSAYRGTAPTAD
jgi:taurine dioxygenase